MKRTTAIALGLLAWLLQTQAGDAQPILNDPNLIGPTILDQLGDVIRSAAQATAAKAAFNQEIADARTAFFAGCARGVREPAASSALGSLLLQKDIYYLSLYLYEGMTPDAQRRVNATNALTGGELDRGLTATGPFEVWTEAVRAEMHAPPPGQFWVPTGVAEAMAAIKATAPQYAAYQAVRDRLEMERWRSSRPTPATTFPTGTAGTPEERAARYDDLVLKPEIDWTVLALPQDQRAEARSKLAAWAAETRKAIVGYETMAPTAELIEGYLRRANYPEDITRTALASLGGMRPTDAGAVSVIARAIQENDQRRDPKTRPLEPVLKVIDLSLHDYAYAIGAGRLTSEQEAKQKKGYSKDLLTYLQTVESPPYQCCTPYGFVRDDLIAGHFRPTPRAPAAKEVDLCTGEPVRKEAIPTAQAPAAPPIESTHALARKEIVPFAKDMLGNNFRALQAMGTLLPSGADKTATFQQLSDRIVKAGKYQVLECTYTDSKASYHFWHGTVPPYFPQLTLAVTIGGMDGDAALMGTRTVEECPTDEQHAKERQNALLHGLDRPNVFASQPEESVIPLSHERIGAVAPNRASFDSWSNIVDPKNVNGFESAIALIMTTNQKVLECDFVVYDQTQSHYYWYKAPPENIGVVIGLVSWYNGVLPRMGTTGRDTCPPSLADARKATAETVEQSRKFVRP